MTLYVLIISQRVNNFSMPYKKQRFVEKQLLLRSDLASISAAIDEREAMLGRKLKEVQHIFYTNIFIFSLKSDTS